jgi:hypothetical protein
MQVTDASSHFERFVENVKLPVDANRPIRWQAYSR